MGPSSQYVTIPNIITTINPNQSSKRRPINPRARNLVLPTTAAPNSRTTPTRPGPPHTRDLQQRPADNHPVLTHALLSGTRANRPLPLHTRLRRADTLRLQPQRPTNRPSPSLPPPPLAEQRAHRLPHGIHRQRGAAPLLRARTDRPLAASHGSAQKRAIRAAARGKYRSGPADACNGCDGVFVGWVWLLRSVDARVCAASAGVLCAGDFPASYACHWWCDAD